MVEPLAFSNPDTRRETYVAAFVSALNDKSDGFPSIEKSIMRLMMFGFDKTAINMFVDEAHEKQFDMSRNRR